MSSHNDNEGTLSVALADLAESMPEDPGRVEGIRARLQRRRNRRRAARAAAGLAVAGATIAVVAAVRPGPAAVSTIPASPSSEAAPVAPPACDSVTPPAASAPADPASLSEAGRAKLAAANAAPSATGRGTPVYGIDGIKGYGTVTAVSDTSITVTLEEQIPGGPADATAAFTDKTLFYDGDAQVIDRPAVNVGDRVAFAAVVDGTGGYNLLLLQAHPAVPEASKPDHGRVTDEEKAQKAAGDAAGDSNYVKGTAKVVSVQADSLTLELRDGSLAGQTVTAGFAPVVTYTVGDQKCVDPTLTAGQVVGVLLMRGDADMYTLQAVAIFRG